MASCDDGSCLRIRAICVDGLAVHGRRVVYVAVVADSRFFALLGDLAHALPGAPKVLFEAAIPPMTELGDQSRGYSTDAVFDRWCEFAAATRVSAGSSWFWADVPAFDVVSQLQQFVLMLAAPAMSANVSTPAHVPTGDFGRIVLSASVAPFSQAPFVASLEGARGGTMADPAHVQHGASGSPRQERAPSSAPQTPAATTSPRGSPAPRAYARSGVEALSSPRVTPPGPGRGGRGGGGAGRSAPATPSSPSPGPGVTSPASPGWWAAPPADRDSYLDAAVRPATRALFRAAGVLLHRSMGAAGASMGVPEGGAGSSSRGNSAPPPREGLFGVKAGELTLLGGKRDGGEADPGSTALREFDEEAGGRLTPAEWGALAAALGGAGATPGERGGERAGVGVGLGGVVAAAAASAAASSGAVQVAWLGGRGPHPAKYVLFLVDVDALAALAGASLDAAPLAALAAAAADLVDRFGAWRGSPAASAAPSEFREMGALMWAPLARVFGASRITSAAPLPSPFLSIVARDPLLKAWVRGGAVTPTPGVTGSGTPTSIPVPPTPPESVLQRRIAESPRPSTAPVMTPEQANRVLGASTSPDEIESALAVLMDAVALSAQSACAALPGPASSTGTGTASAVPPAAPARSQL